jgi:alcohol dehydrogenase (NADP+)
MNHLSFKNGDQIPALGLGTWKSKPGEVRNAIFWAIQAGYRHIDAAAIYNNEKEVGQGIADSIEAGVVKRKDLFITSKLWNNSHRFEDVHFAIEKSLTDLRLDYLDLYLMHWPIAFKPGVEFAQKREDYFTYNDVPLSQTWEAIQETQIKGLAKHIGVSNFNQEKLAEVMKIGRQQPEMNQVEMHPFLPQSELVDFCASNGILMTAYSPLGSLDSRNHKHEKDPKLLTDQVILNIAQKHKISAGQLLIAWSIERGIVVIPKSSNEGRIKENFDSLKVNLDNLDMKELQEIEISHRFVDGVFFTGANSPYNLSDLWDI